MYGGGASFFLLVIMCNQTKLPPAGLALIPLVLLIGLLVCVVSVFGSDALSGASQVALLLASASCVVIGKLHHGMSFDAFEQAVTDKIAGVSQAIVVLLLIGALGGAWMVSGVVPTLIYYGMQLIRPEWFLLSCCIICAVVSVMTGSSWTTIATIGIALLGIGKAQGFHEGWVAGAIISGAYFGDKVSPLSDTTVLASSTVGVPVFTHIRYLMYTTLPAFSVGLLVFAVKGWQAGDTDLSQVAVFTQGLDSTFHITPWLLAVPLLTGIMIARRMPSIVILFLATLMACAAAVWAQPGLLDHIAGEGTDLLAVRFKGVMISVYGSTTLDTGVDALNELVATRGMAGMMSTVWLILCAMIFGGAMTAAGLLDSIVNLFIRFARTAFSLVASTVGAGLFLNTVCADQYLSIILTGNMFRDIYPQNGYEPRLLSRTTEDAVTVTSVLIPWNSCGMTQSTVLGVSTLTYLPYCFFNYLSPLVTLLVAATGYKIVRRTPHAETR